MDPESTTEAPDLAAETAARIEAAQAEQDQPEQDTQDQQDTTAPPERTSAGTDEAPDYFGENFDPATLPDELQPAYKQLRGAWTKKTQELAEQRRAAESAQALHEALLSENPQDRQDALNWLAQQVGGEQTILQALGYEVGDDDAEAPDDGRDDEDLDPQERRLRELENFAAEQQRERERQAQEAEQAAFNQLLESIDTAASAELDALAEQHGEISERERQIVFNHALAKPAPADQDPVKHFRSAVRDAYEELTGIVTERQQRWAKTKATTSPAAGGQAATEVPDLDDPESRQDHLATRIAQTWEQTP